MLGAMRNWVLDLWLPNKVLRDIVFGNTLSIRVLELLVTLAGCSISGSDSFG